MKKMMFQDLISQLHLRKLQKMPDPDTIKAAQESISEDGYWGVNKTSDRLVSMAIALSGGDTSKPMK